MGRPIQVKRIEREAITQERIDQVHAQFMQEMERLFERTKKKHGVAPSTRLQIC